MGMRRALRGRVSVGRGPGSAAYAWKGSRLPGPSTSASFEMDAAPPPRAAPARAIRSAGATRLTPATRRPRSGRGRSSTPRERVERDRETARMRTSPPGFLRDAGAGRPLQVPAASPYFEKNERPGDGRTDASGGGFRAPDILGLRHLPRPIHEARQSGSGSRKSPGNHREASYRQGELCRCRIVQPQRLDRQKSCLIEL